MELLIELIHDAVEKSECVALLAVTMAVLLILHFSNVGNGKDTRRRLARIERHLDIEEDDDAPQGR